MQPDLRDRLRTFFTVDRPGVVAVYVFGSQARGEATPGSDVDLAVLFGSAPAPTLDGAGLSLQGDLERALGRSIDVVVLNSASADLVHRILRDGEVVVDRDRTRRLRFEVARRNEYFDLEPVRRRYRRVIAPTSSAS